MFLSDRFIKGTCPKCGSEEEYGDKQAMAKKIFLQ